MVEDREDPGELILVAGYRVLVTGISATYLLQITSN